MITKHLNIQMIFSHNTYHRDYKAEYEIYKAEVEDTNEKYL